VLGVMALDATEVGGHFTVKQESEGTHAEKLCRGGRRAPERQVRDATRGMEPDHIDMESLGDIALTFSTVIRRL